MKYLIYFIFIILFSGCDMSHNSILNYKNSVVIDKKVDKTIIGDTINRYYIIRKSNSNDNNCSYSIHWISVIEGEFNLFEVGDTIK